MDKGRKAFYWNFLEDEVGPHEELPDQEGGPAALPAGGTVSWLENNRDHVDILLWVFCFFFFSKNNNRNKNR